MSDLTSIQRDTDSRKRIVSDIGTNFFVEAGAGSGKTTMLVRRMVAMVEAGIPIQKICAITFTKAAAGEFYDRFQKLLIERSNPDYVWVDKGHAGQLPKPTEETRKRCEEALVNIDLCFMGTIDSFCGMVLSEHPSEARIPSDSTMLSDEEAKAFYKQIYVKICAGEYGKELSDKADSFRAFYYNPEDVFVKGETLLMGQRNVKFHYTELPKVDIDREFADVRNELIRACRFLSEHPELMPEKDQASVAAWGQIEDTYKTVRRRWSTNLNSIEYALKSLSALRVLPEAEERYGDILNGLFELKATRRPYYLQCVIGGEDGVYTKLLSMKYSCTMAFLDACVPVIESVLREKGKLSFFDNLYYLREMLRRDAEGDGKLIRHIYDRHSYFLIDEFQDTNPMQAEVFFYLASEHPTARWSDCVPRNGTLFIVGDPKQSIYRFRSADVTSFLKVKDLFEKNGGAILSLSRNFRSVRTLCDYYNHVFAELLPEETVNQSKFEEIPLPDETADEFRGLYYYTSYVGKAEAMHPEEADPIQIGRIIDTLVGNENYRVRSERGAEPHTIRYSDIMVITYAKKNLGKIMNYLKEKEIPTRVEGEVPFGASEALTELYKLYAAVADPDNAIALYGALTGKIIGLTKEDILTFKQNGGEVSLRSNFDSEGCENRAACLTADEIAKLQCLHRKALKLSPAALLAKLIDEFKVFEYVETDALEVVYYALELMRSAEKSGAAVSIRDGAGYLLSLINGESGEERCLSLDDNRDAVHMANLHKVKGLEAPVIILAANAAIRGRTPEKRIVHGDDGSDGYLFNLFKDKKGTYVSATEFGDEILDEKEADTAERQRLIYVAATRAKNALIVCESYSARGDKEVRDTVWKPLLDGPHLDEFFMTVPAAEEKAVITREKSGASALYDAAEEASVLNDRGMEEMTFAVENPSRLALMSKMSDVQDVKIIETPHDEVEEERKSSSALHKFPALLGTMVHKLMEMLVTARDREIVIEKTVAEIVREYRTPVLEPFEHDLKNVLIEVAARMNAGGYAQTNGLPQDLMRVLRSADEVYCEVPFCYAERGENGETVWNGVMDLVYRQSDGWHIVDYKTNADGTDLDHKYQAQLAAYVKAFKEITGEEVDAKIYHVDV